MRYCGGILRTYVCVQVMPGSNFPRLPPAGCKCQMVHKASKVTYIVWKDRDLGQTPNQGQANPTKTVASLQGSTWVD